MVKLLQLLALAILLASASAQDCSTFDPDDNWTESCYDGNTPCSEFGKPTPLSSYLAGLYTQRGDVPPTENGGFACRIPPQDATKLGTQSEYTEVPILGSADNNNLLAVHTGQGGTVADQEGWNSLSKDLGQTYPAGTMITFQYNFVSSEGFYIGTQYQDQAQVIADVCTATSNGMAEVMAQFKVDDLAPAKTSDAWDVICSGTQVVEYELTEPASKIVIRIRNIADSALDSILFVDNLGVDNTGCTPGAGGGPGTCSCNPNECTQGGTCVQTNPNGSCAKYVVTSSSGHKKVKLVIP